MYSMTTRGITVSVQPFYLEDQSSPGDCHYVWAYRVRIENHSEETVQLKRRRWQITDARGRIQEVQGAGVVGEQPRLTPGEAYEYTSGTPLPTSSGIMEGAYQMESEGGEKFDVAIPPFSLDNPHEPMRIN